MSGRTLYKRGPHWSRMPQNFVTPLSYDAFERNVKRFLGSNLPMDAEILIQPSTTPEEPTSQGRTKVIRKSSRTVDVLLYAAMIAGVEAAKKKQDKAEPSDTRRQLNAMLKLDDKGLAKAIEDCDTSTREAINKAQNAISLTPEARWLPSDDPYAMSGLAPETVRRSVEIALANTRKNQPGRKEAAYQIELVLTCCEVWSEYKNDIDRGRPGFVLAIFEAAGIPLGVKNLEKLLAKADRIVEARSESRKAGMGSKQQLIEGKEVELSRVR